MNEFYYITYCVYIYMDIWIYGLYHNNMHVTNIIYITNAYMLRYSKLYMYLYNIYIYSLNVYIYIYFHLQNVPVLECIYL